MTHHESRESGKAGSVRHPEDAAAKTAATSRYGRFYRWSLVLGFVLSPAPALALLISLSFQSIPGSVSLSGAGGANATLNFGNVSAFEPLNPGVSRAPGASSYTVSTLFGVRGTHLLAGILSPNYTLQMRLRNAHALTFRVDGMTMSLSPTTVATLQPYGPIVPHTLAVVVPFSQLAGAVTMVLEVTAIAN